MGVTLTVYFDDPFWVGVFERMDGGKLSVCKVTFGAEPKDYEVWEFVLGHYHELKFSPAVEADMLYGRRGETIHRMKPFSAAVKSTLGAGDTFKAGCVWGLLHGMADDELVRFASACSAIAISRFPLPLYPPKLEEVQALIERKE